MYHKICKNRLLMQSTGPYQNNNLSSSDDIQPSTLLSNQSPSGLIL